MFKTGFGPLFMHGKFLLTIWTDAVLNKCQISSSVHCKSWIEYIYWIQVLKERIRSHNISINIWGNCIIWHNAVDEMTVDDMMRVYSTSDITMLYTTKAEGMRLNTKPYIVAINIEVENETIELQSENSQKIRCYVSWICVQFCGWKFVCNQNSTSDTQIVS